MKNLLNIQEKQHLLIIVELSQILGNKKVQLKYVLIDSYLNRDHLVEYLVLIIEKQDNSIVEQNE